MASKINNKQESTFVGSTKGGTKMRKRTYKGKEYKNHVGSFESSDGTGFSIEIWTTDEKYFKETGCAYGYKIAEFGKNSKR